ncbi:MAG: DUF4136 domain-containing protein [Cyclobacteriaceae bacterium]
MKHLLLLFLVTILISCNPKVITYTNPKARFQNFSSYQIVNVKIGKRKLPPEATELLGFIESQIKLEMEERRSYALSNIDPDLVLRYELVSNARTDRNNNNSIFYSPSFSSNVIYESVILIELLSNKRLVWQGSYDLTQSKRESKNENAVKKAIGFIFTTYPYMAGKAVPDPTLTTKKKK